ATGVADQTTSVPLFHQCTRAALGELVGAAVLAHPKQLAPIHILKRVSRSEVKTFAEVYSFLEPRELLFGAARTHYAQQWELADARSFSPLPVQVQSAA